MIYTNVKFEGFWPVGTAAVVRAPTPERAAELLSVELALRGLAQTVAPSDMVPMDEDVVVLRDGAY